jgi:flagellar basal body-associated protein FliL
MSKRGLIIIAIIVLIVIAGMVVSVQRSMKAGTANREPDRTVPVKPAPAQKP